MLLHMPSQFVRTAAEQILFTGSLESNAAEDSSRRTAARPPALEQ